MALSDELRRLLDQMETQGRLAVPDAPVVLGRMIAAEPTAAERQRIEVLLSRMGLKAVSWE